MSSIKTQFVKFGPWPSNLLNTFGMNWNTDYTMLSHLISVTGLTNALEWDVQKVHRNVMVDVLWWYPTIFCRQHVNISVTCHSKDSGDVHAVSWPVLRFLQLCACSLYSARWEITAYSFQISISYLERACGMASMLFKKNHFHTFHRPFDISQTAWRPMIYWKLYKSSLDRWLEVTVTAGNQTGNSGTLLISCFTQLCN